MIVYDYRPYLDDIYNRLGVLSDGISRVENALLASDGSTLVQISTATNSLLYQLSAYLVGFLVFFTLALLGLIVSKMISRLFPENRL